MKNKKQLKDEMFILTSMAEIIGAYEEIAAMRMRKVKKSVLQNRDFISGLNDIYQRVWYTYKHSHPSRNVFHNKTADLGLRSTNNKTLSVLVSANTGLYGDIIKKTFDLFLENVVEGGTDVLVLGKSGKQMLTDSLLHIDYKYFDITDTGFDRNSLSNTIEYILSYTNVIVYHGLYVSILTQNPVKTYVTGKISDMKESTEISELECLIEPSVEEVAHFFEKQILSTIFEQTMFEASLSKFASRMISLDLASENIHKYVSSTKYQTLKYRHNVNNNKQIERLSGIALWG